MDEKTWTVVQFDADQTVEAIPTSWIQGESCHWPPYKQEKIVLSIKKCESLNTSWPRHSIKIFRNATFDDYAKARQKAKVAEEFSDLNSEYETQGKRKRIQKILSSSSSDESLENSLLPSPPKLPKLPKISLLSGTKSSKNRSQISCDSVGTSEYPPKTYQLASNRIGKNLDVNLDVHVNQFPRQGDNDDDNNNENEKTEKNCCLQKEHKILLEIKNQNHMLRGMLVDVLKEVQDLKNTRRTEEISHTSIFVKFQDITFPIDNNEDLSKFEDELKKETIFMEVVNELAKFGGSNPYNFIKRSLSSLLKDGVLKNFSWLGRKGKTPLANSLMAKALIESAGKCLKCDNKQVESAIQSFIKRANERLKSKENKKAGSNN